MRNRTRVPPLFKADSRPLGAKWEWEITMQVASSGYVTRVRAMAWRGSELGRIIGAAFCEVSIFDDVSRAIEEAAVEAMLCAVQPTLDGSLSEREFRLGDEVRAVN